MSSHQLKFKRQGDSMVCVHPSVAAQPKRNHKKKILIGSILIAGIGFLILFLIDGGIGLLSAGVVEAVKWTHRNRDTMDAFIHIASKKPF